MSDAQSLTVEILKQIRSDLKDGLEGLRGEIQKTNERLGQTNERLDHTNLRLENVKELQNLLLTEHRKTNHRLDFFAEELVRMRTRDNERISALESAVAELQRKVS